ncbi:hypothetical protein ACSTHW_23240, partial [Vibrio parahaemolyticus]
MATGFNTYGFDYYSRGELFPAATTGTSTGTTNSVFGFSGIATAAQTANYSYQPSGGLSLSG